MESGSSGSLLILNDIVWEIWDSSPGWVEVHRTGKEGDGKGMRELKKSQLPSGAAGQRKFPAAERTAEQNNDLD